MTSPAGSSWTLWGYGVHRLCTSWCHGAEHLWAREYNVIALAPTPPSLSPPRAGGSVQDTGAVLSVPIGDCHTHEVQQWCGPYPLHCPPYSVSSVSSYGITIGRSIRRKYNDDAVSLGEVSAVDEQGQDQGDQYQCPEVALPLAPFPVHGVTVGPGPGVAPGTTSLTRLGEGRTS